jgi:hypothetical protein
VAQHALLGAIVAGETVGSAIARAAAVSTAPDETFAAELGEWFRTWTTAGFFRDVVA